jgi:hypothetical protein
MGLQGPFWMPFDWLPTWPGQRKMAQALPHCLNIAQVLLFANQGMTKKKKTRWMPFIG